MRSLAIVAVVVLATVVVAQPPIHHVPRALPPGFEKVLPPDVIQKLRAIHESTSMTPEQQHEKIDEIMSSLPPEIHDKLPTPPFFAKLPPATQAQLKALHRDRTLTWKQRHEKIRAVIDALPPNLRPPPPPGPPPHHQGFGRHPDFRRQHS
ncbi:hypothetical protein Q1695_007734 [Nippostrongylus brasiliensis]|nr:hypothetical protein Q1695_007734 [Nippostrongylus brasiliensis]